MLFDQVRQLDHQFSSICAGDLSPFSLEGLSCCGNGLVDVLGCAGFDRANLALVTVSWVSASVSTSETEAGKVARLQRGGIARVHGKSGIVTEVSLHEHHCFDLRLSRCKKPGV